MSWLQGYNLHTEASIVKLRISIFQAIVLFQQVMKHFWLGKLVRLSLETLV
jgi:hypothetical protein